MSRQRPHLLYIYRDTINFLRYTVFGAQQFRWHFVDHRNDKGQFTGVLSPSLAEANADSNDIRFAHQLRLMRGLDGPNARNRFVLHIPHPRSGIRLAHTAGGWRICPRIRISQESG